MSRVKQPFILNVDVTINGHELLEFTRLILIDYLKMNPCLPKVNEK